MYAQCVLHNVIHLDRPGVSVVGMLWCQMLPRMLNLFALFSQILQEVCKTKAHQQQQQQRNRGNNYTTVTKQHDKTATNQPQ